MSDEADFIASNYPVPVFRFIVNIGGDVIRCNSVGGLDQQFETGEYRDGMGGIFRFITRQQLPSITLSQAVFLGKCKLYEWLYNYSNNTDGKKDISISLTDESGKVLYVTWNVVNAFPTGITGPNLDASSNEVAVKQITLNADRLTVTCH
ncbi:phage tail protein [Xenorhabdus sp. 42]|uniref:phage tail protein n=1 Tax=Xenorhabdus szentirmaii TaxID=290112 RepID=UPI0019B5AA2E|nr:MULTISPECIES: phage tail protein [unclassified Xenorhabdus]MBD2794012.1 phage tail protein [Xenorhabdus sp. CUL]MBD2803840.1 phage tail protein [Xenorhabdus sp. ZM]MBD2819786.1 phage tail protein [Xenorhabdus sp. 42]MBD2826602.1 phage tail protein [Xenorhabdus sp. 5]